MRRSGRPLNVAIVAASLRILGGHSVQAQRLLDGWRADAGVRAWLVPINPLPPRGLLDLLKIRFVRTIVTQLCYWPLLAREVRRADLIHIFAASYTSFLLAPLPAILMGKLLHRRVLVNYHSGEAPDHLARSPLARYVLRSRVDLNVVPSTFLRDVFASFGIQSMVVPNTLDLSAFAYRARDPLRPRLVSTRNFETVYNVPCTLRAFRRIQDRYPDASLTLVGSGSQDSELRVLASDLGLRHVVFTGRVEPHDVSRYYAEADIYVQTPSIDNMPLSVLEAFASGLPVVSTNVGGMSTMLADGVHGLLAPSNNADAIAGQVIRLLEQPAFARQLASAAHDICSRYQWPIVRDGWLMAYQRAMDRTRSEGALTRDVSLFDTAHAERRSPAGEQTESA